MPRTTDHRCDVDLPKLFSTWVPAVGARAIRRPLTADERALVVVRAVELREALVAFADDEAAAARSAIAAMFTGYRSMRQQGADVVATVEATLGTLSIFPLWAIQEGCLMIRRRQVPGHVVMLDPHWPPSDTEVCMVVAHVVAYYRRRLDSAEALLAAPVEDPEPPQPTAEPSGLTYDEARQSQARADDHEPLRAGDGKHAQRVMAELAQRRARREAQSNRARELKATGGEATIGRQKIAMKT